MKYYISLLSVVILALSTMLFDNLSTNPYLPYPNGSSIVYAVFPITGAWHENTGKLDILTRGAAQPSQVITFSQTTCDRLPSLPLYNNYFHLTNTPNEPPTWWASLVNGVDTVSGKQYIGEYVDQKGWLKMPAEAILSMNPIAGETIESTNTTVYQSCDVNSPVLVSGFHWKYWTIAYNATWGVFADTWRTALHEYGDGVTDCGNVYNYVFQRNVGAVDFWTIKPNCVTGIGSGFEFYATGFLTPVTTVTPTITPTATDTQTPTVTPTPEVTPALIPTGECFPVSAGTMCFFINTPTE